MAGILGQADIKTNQVVGEKNFPNKSVGMKWSVYNFTRNYLWKCIGCIILAVTDGIKGQRLWENLKHPLVRRGELHCKLHYIDMFTRIHI